MGEQTVCPQRLTGCGDEIHPQLSVGSPLLDGSITGKAGRVYGQRAGFCLETQHFPDAPNQPDFPSTILRPGEEYVSKTVFTFGTR